VNGWQVNGTHAGRADAGNAGTTWVPVTALTIAGTTGAWTGKLDLTTNALILTSLTGGDQATLVTRLKDQAASGRAGGAWNGPGITSSTLAVLNATSSSYSLAIADAGDLALTAYRGQVGLDGNSTIVALARNGDANIDGKVDAFDLNLLASHWQQQSGALWSVGDFTGDGIVNAFDLNALAANWQFGVGGGLVAALAAFPGLSGAAVPEPASLSVLVLGGGALLLRRRRR
jgi:hypothetical protein